MKKNGKIQILPYKSINYDKYKIAFCGFMGSFKVVFRAFLSFIWLLVCFSTLKNASYCKPICKPISKPKHEKEAKRYFSGLSLNHCLNTVYMTIKHNAITPLSALFTGFWCIFTHQLKRGAIKAPLFAWSINSQLTYNSHFVLLRRFALTPSKPFINNGLRAFYGFY